MDRPINPNKDGFDCMCKALPHQLLFVCRVIHYEVQAILYSENMFTICRSDNRGLSALRQLSSKAVASLTSLSIAFNACACVPGHRCPDAFQEEKFKFCLICHDTCRGGTDEPVKKRSRADRRIIRDWR